MTNALGGKGQAQIDSSADKVEADEKAPASSHAGTVAVPRKPLDLEELAAFRATMPSLGRLSAEILREIRDED